MSGFLSMWGSASRGVGETGGVPGPGQEPEPEVEFGAVRSGRSGSRFERENPSLGGSGGLEGVTGSRRGVALLESFHRRMDRIELQGVDPALRPKPRRAQQIGILLGVVFTMCWSTLALRLAYSDSSLWLLIGDLPFSCCMPYVVWNIWRIVFPGALPDPLFYRIVLGTTASFIVVHGVEVCFDDPNPLTDDSPSRIATSVINDTSFYFFLFALPALVYRQQYILEDSSSQTMVFALVFIWIHRMTIELSPESDSDTIGWVSTGFTIVAGTAVLVDAIFSADLRPDARMDQLLLKQQEAGAAPLPPALEDGVVKSPLAPEPGAAPSSSTTTAANAHPQSEHLASSPPFDRRATRVGAVLAVALGAGVGPVLLSLWLTGVNDTENEKNILLSIFLPQCSALVFVMTTIVIERVVPASRAPPLLFPLILSLDCFITLRFIDAQFGAYDFWLPVVFNAVTDVIRDTGTLQQAVSHVSQRLFGLPDLTVFHRGRYRRQMKSITMMSEIVSSVCLFLALVIEEAAFRWDVGEDTVSYGFGDGPKERSRRRGSAMICAISIIAVNLLVAVVGNMVLDRKLPRFIRRRWKSGEEEHDDRFSLTHHGTDPVDDMWAENRLFFALSATTTVPTVILLATLFARCACAHLL
uniref:Uncharacterized protein n=1 Tax=Rhizochromulina marina TaxID=1034831 RepID=A0A7S2W9V2_9STRA